MDSLEGQTLDHREKAHSLAFLLFFAERERKNASVKITDENKANSQVLTHTIKLVRLFYELLCTCDSCGLFQLTGTKALELEPEEVEEVLSSLLSLWASHSALAVLITIFISNNWCLQRNKLPVFHSHSST